MQQQQLRTLQQQQRTTTTTTAVTTQYEAPAAFIKQGVNHQHQHHAGGGLNCPCCNERIVGEVKHNEGNYVELQEVKTMVREKIVPSVVSNKSFVPNKNTQYCSIPGCTVCEGMYRMKEQTDRKVIIHREVSHACDFQCKFCAFNAADDRLLQLLEEHHIKKAQLKRSAAASLHEAQQQQQQQQQQSSENLTEQEQQQQFFEQLQQQDQGYYGQPNFSIQQPETLSINESSRLSVGSQRI